MPMKNNYYDTLGLNRHADEKQVKDAYRRLAREHHPDVNPGDADAGHWRRNGLELLASP